MSADTLPGAHPSSRASSIPAELEAFFEMAQRWDLSTEQQIILLGSPGRSTFFKWKKEGGSLPRDTGERLSHLLAIWKALRILFTDDRRGEDVKRKKLAKEIAAMHPLAIRSMVQTTRMREDAFGGVGGLDATMRREAYAQALCYAKSDWGEGLDAAIEKRQPDFSDYHDSDW